RYIFHITISTKIKDLSRGQMKAGWAKYTHFSKFTSAGLVLTFVLFGLSMPIAQAQARTSSYLFSKFIKFDSVETPSLRAEAQNSQTIAFLEGVVNFDTKKAIGGGDITMDDQAFSSEVGPSGTIADIESSSRQGKVSLYVVRSGDTVEQIAKMFDVTVSTILWANDLSRGASLRIGQHLVILPIDGVQHVVKKGDTLKEIAKKYKGDIDEILEFNNITVEQKLSIGDVVIVPNGKEVTIATSGKTSGSRAKVIAAYPSIGGYYSHPVPDGHKTQGVHGYNGVDYGAPIGTPVYASAEGAVIVSRFQTLSNPWFGGYGNYIVIEHPNGTQTLYAHLSAVYTPIGARVDKGQVIGEVGNTGKSTGPHLHFEVRGAKNPF
ncbi:MAG: peptidoglycan DD-metalloendopeptidase family protein, partial [Minisyncoccia bacterium]